MDLLAEDGKEYIEICVNPNTYPVNYRGEYHYRSGSTKQQLKGQALNMVTFCGLHKTTLQSPQTILQLDEINSKIIKIIESNPSISQRKIAVLVGVSYDAVRYHTENMRKRLLCVREIDGVQNGFFMSCIN